MKPSTRIRRGAAWLLDGVAACIPLAAAVFTIIALAAGMPFWTVVAWLVVAVAGRGLLRLAAGLADPFWLRQPRWWLPHLSDLAVGVLAVWWLFH